MATAQFTFGLDRDDLEAVAPIDILGAALRQAVASAVGMLEDHPGLKQVPVYEAGQAEPWAYVVRR